MLATITAFVPSFVSTTGKNYHQLLHVLTAAGISVIDNPEELPKANCSIHIIGSEYKTSKVSGDKSDEEYWLKKSIEHMKGHDNFRIFIWQPSFVNINNVSEKQKDFIQSIRNNLLQNTAYCNHASPVMFVDDIRNILLEEQPATYQSKSANIFFIYNEIDEEKGGDIVELLKDLMKIEKLNLSLRSDTDYSEVITQQINKSDISVVYFHRTANWALPFVQQIWKNIGGASADKPILFIGDSESDQNTNVHFDAPNVTSIISSTELIPLEIKVFHDKLFSGQ